MFRLNLFQLAAQEFTFVWTSHHAIIDGRSRLVVLTELFAIYDCLCDGREVQLPAALPFWTHPLKDLDTPKMKGFLEEALRGQEPMPPMAVKIEEWGKLGTEDSHATIRLKLIPDQTAALESFCRENGLPSTLCSKGHGLYY